jgi:hypothetical protein
MYKLSCGGSVIDRQRRRFSFIVFLIFRAAFEALLGKNNPIFKSLEQEFVTHRLYRVAWNL